MGGQGPIGNNLPSHPVLRTNLVNTLDRGNNQKRKRRNRKRKKNASPKGKNKNKSLGRNAEFNLHDSGIESCASFSCPSHNPSHVHPSASNQMELSDQAVRGSVLVSTDQARTCTYTEDLAGSPVNPEMGSTSLFESNSTQSAPRTDSTESFVDPLAGLIPPPESDGRRMVSGLVSVVLTASVGASVEAPASQDGPVGGSESPQVPSGPGREPQPASKGASVSPRGKRKQAPDHARISVKEPEKGCERLWEPTGLIRARP